VNNEDQAEIAEMLRNTRRIADANERFAQAEETLVAIVGDKRATTEQWRQQCHHDVLCLVLGKLLDRHHFTSILESDTDRQIIAGVAQRFADWHYPPPKVATLKGQDARAVLSIEAHVAKMNPPTLSCGCVGQCEGHAFKP
jgi:hypothetical protein